MSVAIFEKPGVRFLYPEGWTVTDEQWAVEPRSVTIQSPVSGFWSLHVYQQADPQELLTEALVAMRDEYDALECERVTETTEAGEALGYDVTFYCLDLVVTARIRALEVGSVTYLLISQAEDRDFERLREVFQAMLFSLLTV